MDRDSSFLFWQRPCPLLRLLPAETETMAFGPPRLAGRLPFALVVAVYAAGVVAIEVVDVDAEVHQWWKELAECVLSP